MNVRTQDTLSNHEEVLERLAKGLSGARNRLALFKLIYGSNKRSWSLDELKERTDLPHRTIRNTMLAMFRLQIVDKVDSDSKAPTYRKNHFAAHHQRKLISLAESKDKIAAIPTKRKPTLSAPSLPPANPRRRSSSPSKPKRRVTALCLTASPGAGVEALRVDAETKKIQEHIRGSRYRDRLDLLVKPAAGFQTLLNALNDARPEIVQFSGHGGGKAIEMDNGEVNSPDYQNVSYEVLGSVLAATDSPPRLLILNACSTADGAADFLANVDFVIAMSDPISDMAASAFVPQFYSAIGSGQSINSAFLQAQAVVQQLGISEERIPQLLSAPGKDASKATFF
ncbi:CHAT domain-containing protein [Maricaulis sp.]|uniref:CHAT domain-containing protein n=1 Tax=Maricaulis sp. TaxID=1486257 RepID=UPI003A8F1F8B